jgi:hypothetical protein
MTSSQISKKEAEAARQLRSQYHASTACLIADALMLFFAVFLLATAIFLPGVNTCDGWCCSSRTLGSAELNDARLPYKTQDAKVPLHKYAREVSEDDGSNSTLMILEPFYSSLATLHVGHQPLYNLPRLAAETHKPVGAGEVGAVHCPNKNHFQMVTLSGKRGSADELYYSVYLAQALAKKDAIIMMNGTADVDAPAWQAWSRLVREGIVHWKLQDHYHHAGQHWVVGRFKQVDPRKAVSEYVSEVFHLYLNLPLPQDLNLSHPQASPVSETVHYVTSQTREDDVRRAYAKDTSFEVTNVTSAIHGAVLKVLFPKIELRLPTPVAELPVESLEEKEEEQASNTANDTNSSDPLFAQALLFLKTYILI